MEAGTLTRSRAPRAGLRLPGVGAGLGRGMVVLYLSLIVLLPIAAMADKSLSGGLGYFWEQVTSPQAIKSLVEGIRASKPGMATTLFSCRRSAIWSQRIPGSSRSAGGSAAI